LLYRFLLSLRSRLAIYAALAISLFSLIGLRGIFITPALTKALNSDSVALTLTPIYWIALIISLFILILNYASIRGHILRIAAEVREHAHSILVSLAAAIPFLALAIDKRLPLDFWLDELMSIKNHILPSLGNALFWYPLPNNHIFGNVLSGLFLRLLGWNDLLLVLKEPERLRILYLAYGVATIICIGILADRFIGQWGSAVSVVLLCTTIPYLNFVAQVRGYSPAILFACAQLLAILRYRSRPTRASAISIIILTAMILYTIPSNIYYLSGIALYFGAEGLIRLVGTGNRKSASLESEAFVFVNPGLSMLGFVLLGIMLSLLLYLPVLPRLLKSHYVNSAGILHGTALPDTFLHVVEVFISNRGWLFLIAVIGLISSGTRAARTKDANRFPIMLGLSGFILPFVLSFIRGDSPPARAFLISLPVFIAISTYGLHHLLFHSLKLHEQAGWIRPLLLAMIAVYCYGTFASEYRRFSSLVYQNLAGESAGTIDNTDERLTASVFLDHYSLRSIINSFQNDYDRDLPVVIDEANTRYPWTLVTYLDAFGIPFVSYADFAQSPHSEGYIFLSYPERSLSTLAKLYPGTVCEPVSKVVSIYRIVHCWFNGDG
jgi:hypothetical protein